MGGQRHALAALTPGRTRYPLYRRLGGPQGRSGRVRRISPSSGFDPRSIQLVASRYTEYTIPARHTVRLPVLLVQRFRWTVGKETCSRNPVSEGSLLSTWVYEGKCVPLQACSGPSGSRRSRLSDFKTVGLSTLRTGRLYLPGNIPVLISVGG